MKTDNDSYIDSVHDLRNQYGADIVIMLSDVNGSCGRVYQVMSDPTSTTNEEEAFAIVDYTCATGNYTFGHEIGHLVGARHDWITDGTNNSPYTFNHGHTEPADSWRTIMSYANSQCGSCARLLRWSNPDQTFNGYPLGIAEGNNQAADNRKTWSLTKDIVANYRNSVVPFPEPEKFIVPILYLLLIDE